MLFLKNSEVEPSGKLPGKYSKYFQTNSAGHENIFQKVKDFLEENKWI